MVVPVISCAGNHPIYLYLYPKEYSESSDVLHISAVICIHQYYRNKQHKIIKKIVESGQSRSPPPPVQHPKIKRQQRGNPHPSSGRGWHRGVPAFCCTPATVCFVVGFIHSTGVVLSYSGNTRAHSTAQYSTVPQQTNTYCHTHILYTHKHTRGVNYYSRTEKTQAHSTRREGEKTPRLGVLLSILPSSMMCAIDRKTPPPSPQ